MPTLNCSSVTRPGISDTGDQGKECWKIFTCSRKSELENAQENLTSTSHTHTVVSLLTIVFIVLITWKDVVLRN